MHGVWSLETHGDPLGKLRHFITLIWVEAGLDGMLVTMDEGSAHHAIPGYITESTSIQGINPFKPLMEINAARLVPELLAAHPGKKIAALLRPCEMRALAEMVRHASLNLDHILTLCVDCLGTLPADEYQWRLERAGRRYPASDTTSQNITDELATEALRFARQGGIVPYRYRAACQVCPSPAAEKANINIHSLGIPVRQQLLVEMKDHPFFEHFHLETLVDKEADPDLLVQHGKLLSKIAERHRRTLERVKEGLGSLLPVELDSLISQFDSCGECQICMNICPICSVVKPNRNANGQYDRSDVLNWLISCAGCGMCEQSCPRHLPLYSIFAHIRQQLDQEQGHVPSHSLDGSL